MRLNTGRFRLTWQLGVDNTFSMFRCNFFKANLYISFQLWPVLIFFFFLTIRQSIFIWAKVLHWIGNKPLYKPLIGIIGAWLCLARPLCQLWQANLAEVLCTRNAIVFWCSEAIVNAFHKTYFHFFSEKGTKILYIHIQMAWGFTTQRAGDGEKTHALDFINQLSFLHPNRFHEEAKLKPP